MTVEELSARIIDDTFLQHEDNSDDILCHYGILGMKWGIRRTPEQLGHRKVSKKKEWETDQQYKDRLDRESRERQASADRKARAKEQKRTLRSQEKIKKAELKTQERIKKKELDNQFKREQANRDDQRRREEKAAKEQAKNKKKKTSSKLEKNDKITAKIMTDQELRDAINRMQMERQYRDLTKKPDGTAKKLGKAVVAMGVGIGATIVKKQLTKAGNDIAEKKINAFLKKDDSSSKGKSGGSNKSGGKNVDADQVRKIIEEWYDERND